jgi:hypothetical protein
MRLVLGLKELLSNAIYFSDTGSILENAKNQYPIAMQSENLYIYFFFLLSFFALPYAFELILLLVVYSTYFTVFNSI